MRFIPIYALCILSFVVGSCGQNQRKAPDETTKADTGNIVSPYGPNAMVRNVRQGRNGSILVASSRAGVFRYDGQNFTKLTGRLGSRRFWDVLEDRRGHLWFSTTDSGVYRYDGASFHQFTTREGLASNSVGAIYEDRAGAIWFATGGGASRYDGKSFRNFTTKDGLPNNDVTTIMEDKTGRYWFGTRGDACFYDGKTVTVFRNKEGKAFHNVWSILEDRTGMIWFGGSIIRGRNGKVLVAESGLWRYDGSTVTKVSRRGASFLIDDRKGGIWTTGSVQPPNGSVWALSRYEAKPPYTNKPAMTEIMAIKGPGMLCGILAASDGTIWFGALGAKSGVYRYDGKTITDFRRKAEQR